MSFLIALLLLVSGVAFCDDAAWDKVPAMIKPVTNEIEAAFTLVRHFNEMDYDMKGNGTMSFSPGKKLFFRTEAPMRVEFELTPTEMRIKDIESGSTNTVTAKKAPHITQAFMLQDDWFKGDTTDLKKEFDLIIQDSNTLLFTPKNPQIKEMFTSMQLHIDPATRHVSKIVLNEVSGDNITININNVKEI